MCESNFTVYSPEFISKQQNIGFNEIGYGNRLTLNEGKILENVQNIQLSNGLKPSTRSEVDRKELDFTVEMETGTGKTYVYLRTVFEMNRLYGFSKFIIVVPSIAVKEGVQKSLEITASHFKALYENITFDYFTYDSSKLSDVRNFATSPDIQVMVINIDAFRKSFTDPEQENKEQCIGRCRNY